MCISAEALALFLSLLAPEVVTRVPGLITVHAEAGDVEWVARGPRWCTDDR